MPTVTVLAPDSALAMDEVIRQLGDNAYILSTHARDGQVEILATNEPAQIQPPRKRATSVSFADVISEQVSQAVGPDAIFRSVRAGPAQLAEQTPQPAPSQGATIVMMHEARARSPQAAPMANRDTVMVAPPQAPVENPSSSLWQADLETLKASTPSTQNPETPPSPAESADEGLQPILRELSAQLARLQAIAAPKPNAAHSQPDPLQAAGFSVEIVKRLAPGRAEPERMSQFVTAMANRLTAPDPLMSLRAPVVMIVGPSGAGKTVLASKFAALALETQTTRAVELVSVSETSQVANTALPIYARMLSIRHKNVPPNQLDAIDLSMTNTTHVFDTNLEPQTLRQKLTELRAQLGHIGVAVILALPVGTSLVRIRDELNKYKEFDPVIALTKLDECEFSSEEASQIAEIGTPIAWLSGTRALTETMAPATEEMMNEFLTGLLAVRP